MLLVEDLISTGGSAVRSVDILRTDGQTTIADVVAIFTYDLLVSKEKEQEAKVKFHTLSNFKTLLEVAAQQGRINNDEINHIAEFSKNPAEWAE